MKFDEIKRRLLPRTSIPISIEFDGNTELDKIRNNDYSINSLMLLDIIESIHSLKRFDDEFELLCMDELRNRIEILDFQIDTAKQTFQRMSLRALLADEVGLGKTIEAGIVTKELMTRQLVNSILVIAPVSLIYQWKEELNIKFSIRLIEPSGAMSARKDNFLITSLNRIANKKSKIGKPIQKREWDMIIIDEAHYLKNHRTQRYKYVQQMNSKYLLLLTATPVQNNMRELYNIMHLLRPGVFSTYRQFKTKYCRGANERALNYHNIRDLRKVVRNNMIRHRRADVGIDFSLRVPKDVKLEMTPEEMEVYNDIFNLDVLSLAKVTLLKMTASSSRAIYGTMMKRIESQMDVYQDLYYQIQQLNLSQNKDSKLQYLKKVLNKHDKVVVFVEYNDTQDFLIDYCRSNSIAYSYLSGRQNQEKRREAIIDFKTNGHVFIASPAGMEGLNLQFANVVVNYDLPWNPMRVEQRIGRLHRIGQERRVYIYNLVKTGTIEERIIELLYEKLKLFYMSIGEIDAIFEETYGEDYNFDTKISQMVDKSRNVDEMDYHLRKMSDDMDKNKDAAKRGGDFTSKLIGD